MLWHAGGRQKYRAYLPTYICVRTYVYLCVCVTRTYWHSYRLRTAQLCYDEYTTIMYCSTVRTQYSTVSFNHNFAIIKYQL